MFSKTQYDSIKDIESRIPRTPPIETNFSTDYLQMGDAISPKSSRESLAYTDPSTGSDAPDTPLTEPYIDVDNDTVSSLAVSKLSIEPRARRASTSLLSQDGEELRKILGENESGTKLIQKYCCGGGCCLAKPKDTIPTPNEHPVPLPTNAAFKSLKLNLNKLSLDTTLTSTTDLPPNNISFASIPSSSQAPANHDLTQPPSFVQPHPPYHTFSAPVFHARELTKPGAEKRTFHFDLDVTDYPDEGGVDFKVGGAIGICPPNEDSVVEDIFDRLGVPKFVRDKPVVLKTGGGRWPTIWGEEEARELVTTRRELLTWTCDLQSSPPTKPLLRVLAEYASDACEAKILNYLVSAEGQGAFCDLRTGPHLTLSQLLHAFPSSHPPLDLLMTVLKQLMPRFYSLSNDPCISSERDGLAGRRLVEIAVSVHETADWNKGTRTGTGSGYLERVAQQLINAKDGDTKPIIKVPIFRGLMSNPLTKEFTNDGPMLLIGAGVGMAPFRGYILNRLKNASCANKVWLLQGIRDASVDELYQGELGDHESSVKRVVQSRKLDRQEGEAKYVQEEVMHQADIVWFVINSIDGRVCVCGSSKGMGEGVWDALVKVVMQKGGMNRDEAENFWKAKQDVGQYVAEMW